MSGPQRAPSSVSLSRQDVYSVPPVSFAASSLLAFFHKNGPARNESPRVMDRLTRCALKEFFTWKVVVLSRSCSHPISAVTDLKSSLRIMHVREHIRFVPSILLELLVGKNRKFKSSVSLDVRALEPGAFVRRLKSECVLRPFAHSAIGRPRAMSLSVLIT